MFFFRSAFVIQDRWFKKSPHLCLWMHPITDFTLQNLPSLLFFRNNRTCSYNIDYGLSVSDLSFGCTVVKDPPGLLHSGFVVSETFV